MIDNSEIDKILLKLENMEDEELAVELLARFNRASSDLGKILLNLDKSLSHSEWKNRCDQARIQLNNVILEIGKF